MHWWPCSQMVHVSMCQTFTSQWKWLLDLDISINCDIDSGLIEHPGYSWLQPILYVNHSYYGFIFRNECAFDYCKPSRATVFLNFSADVNDDQCATGHTGTLCGACKDGYSLTFYNFQCKVCENRYISLLLFFGFAGMALIAVLLVLHMTVATGTINGLILYANIVNIIETYSFHLGTQVSIHSQYS